MNKLLKDIFNYKTIITSFIGAIGYGFGYGIGDKLGFPMIVSLLCCFALGIPFDLIGKKIVSLKILDNSKKNRFIVILLIYLVYLIFWFISFKLLKHDLDFDLLYYFGFIVLFQLISFVISYIGTLIKKK